MSFADLSRVSFHESFMEKYHKLLWIWVLVFFAFDGAMSRESDGEERIICFERKI